MSNPLGYGPSRWPAANCAVLWRLQCPANDGALIPQPAFDGWVCDSFANGWSASGRGQTEAQARAACRAHALRLAGLWRQTAHDGTYPADQAFRHARSYVQAARQTGSAIAVDI